MVVVVAMLVMNDENGNNKDTQLSETATGGIAIEVAAPAAVYSLSLSQPGRMHHVRPSTSH
jgi:hypothetical protein